jgi:hypothetical protein
MRLTVVEAHRLYLRSAVVVRNVMATNMMAVKFTAINKQSALASS